MGLTLTQLVEAKTKEQLREELLLALRGVGHVRKTGSGEGSLSLRGTALAARLIVVGIRGDGGLGVGTFRYSLDAGATSNGADILIPSGGEYELPGTGVTLLFTNGPGEPADSFFIGDEYSFELTVPTLPTTSWHSGSTPRTIIEVDADVCEDFAATIQGIAKGGYLTTAEGSWLDLLLEDVYDIERERGQAAQHSILLTDTAGGGPHSILPGQLVVGTATGLRFANTEAGTLAQDGTLLLTFQAEQRGTAYNVPPGSINVLLTSLPGVSVTNPDAGNGTSTIRQGVNRETDEAARARAMLRWPSLGSGATADTYALWAREASPDVTRTLVLPDADMPGKVDMYLAGPAGPVSELVEGLVEAAIEPRVPLGTTIDIASATSQAVTVEATIYVRAGYSSSALAGIEQNLTAYIQGGRNTVLELLPGIPISDGNATIYVSELIEQMQLPSGVRNVVLTAPAADIIIGAPNLPRVAVLEAPTLTLVEVS